MRGAALICLFALALGGCAGYRLGPTNAETAGARTVQVVPFNNETLEPRLSEDVAEAIRRDLQRDGTYRVDSQGRADIVVTGTLIRYVRNALSYKPDQALTAEDYRVSLTGHVIATDRQTGRVLVDKSVTGYTIVRIFNDLTSAEREARPLLAEDFAKHVNALLVDGSW